MIFFEPKILYRSSVELVPEEDFTIPLSKAEILKEGNDLTVIGWGSQIYVLEQAIERAEKEFGISCELIDVRTILPFDLETMVTSVRKTGRCIISHEAPLTGGFASELSSRIMENCFLNLEAPIVRVCGFDTPFPLVYEKFYLPNVTRCFDAIKKLIQY